MLLFIATVMNGLEKFTSTTIITVTVCAITLIEAILKMSTLKFILPVGLYVTALVCDKESTFLVTRIIYETTKDMVKEIWRFFIEEGPMAFMTLSIVWLFVNAVQRGTGELTTEPKTNTN